MAPNRFANFIKNSVSVLICLFGIPLIVRWICQNKVAILLYHDVSPNVFTKHLSYLSRHYKIITLDTLVSGIHDNDFSEVPPKSVVITIDDGHVGNIALLPIIKQYRIRPTIYVCTQIINRHRYFWFRIPKQTKRKKERLKRLPNVERLAHLKESTDFEPENEYQDRQSLNIEEMREMMDCVDFEPHTQFHPILPNCNDIECKQEILGSKMDLEELLGKECLHFSYPNGDYSEREIEIVKSGGFRSARTSDIGWNTCGTSAYHLKTIPMSDDAGLMRLRAELTTIPQRIGRWVNSILWKITN